jgi:hypothetical protein
MTHFAKIACLIIATTLLWGCSSTRHVPDGELLLNSVDINVVDNQDINTLELYNFLRQTPNHKVLGFAKLQLGTYNLSGNDTTHWYNRWLRRIGQAPVIYDNDLTITSGKQLRQALINKGYMGARVDIDTLINSKKKTIDLTYRISAGTPHTISSISYEIPDTTIRDIIMADSAMFTISPSSLFDRNELDNERTLITERLRDHGYYTFNKDFITFTADTARGSKEIDLTMHVHQPKVAPNAPIDSLPQHLRYNIRNVIFVTDFDAKQSGGTYNFGRQDTVIYNNLIILYGSDHYIKPSILDEKCFIDPGMAYNSKAIDRTYEALGQLGILKFINIDLKPVGTIDNTAFLDAYVLLSRGKKQGVTFEVEGTNSEGDLGFGAGVTYQHRNLAHGSELLTAKFRASYESLSGDLNGLINDTYSEYAGEVALTFPKFEFPFLSKSLKQRMKANTEFSISANYQERPEYTRIIAGAAWKYKWTSRMRNYTQSRHQFDLIDINYVYLPQSTLNFMDEIAPTNPLLRYSYEDHFIMRLGYTYYRTNRRIPTATINAFAMQPSVFTLRASAEMAGNLLYGISSLVNSKKEDGAYKIFGIQYAQYVKGEVDYTYTRNFNSRNAFSVHGGLGIGYPYGNSSMIPFEKRFYAGGANGVRGWGVRTLGPGRYDSRNSVSNFIYQCGDISLNMSMEYRAKLFWVFEGALFVDAGNIWTIKNYETQPGGQFKFNSFYKEIALAYGAGIRMDFTYFLLRFDLGMKAHNPAINQEPWPIIHPKWGRDATFHFSVGYPF